MLQTDSDIPQFIPKAQCAPYQEIHTLGMSEMGFKGISEVWLMKRLGDIHWRLIADSLGQREAVFFDIKNRPTYAAFCATSINISRPTLPALGKMIKIESELKRATKTRLISRHNIFIDEQYYAQICMISVFVIHGKANKNTSLLKSELPGIERVPTMPTNWDQGLLAAASDIAKKAPQEAKNSLSNICQLFLHSPCPTTSFNAVGLLYFANFIDIFDCAEWNTLPELSIDYQTQSRMIVFMGNIDPGQKLLSQIEQSSSKNSSYAHTIKLFSEDKKCIAYATTLKRK